MFLASAYPNSALSAGQLTLIALVMAGVLALWLGLVFLADRKSREPDAQESGGYRAVVGEPHQADVVAQFGATEDDHSGNGTATRTPTSPAAGAAA